MEAKFLIRRQLILQKMIMAVIALFLYACGTEAPESRDGMTETSNEEWIDDDDTFEERPSTIVSEKANEGGETSAHTIEPDDYKVVLGMDEHLEINETGELRVSIGSESMKVTCPEKSLQVKHIVLL